MRKFLYEKRKNERQTQVYTPCRSRGKSSVSLCEVAVSLVSSCLPMRTDFLSIVIHRVLSWSIRFRRVTFSVCSNSRISQKLQRIHSTPNVFLLVAEIGYNKRHLSGVQIFFLFGSTLTLKNQSLEGCYSPAIKTWTCVYSNTRSNR